MTFHPYVHIVKRDINKGQKCKSCNNIARVKGLCVNCYVLKRYHEKNNLG